MSSSYLTKSAVVAGALAAPLALAAPASATGGIGAAYGIAANGLVNIPQTPAVSSAQAPESRSLAELPANPLADLKVLHVSASAQRARASVTDLRVARALLSADTVTATCQRGEGASHLAGARIAGHPLAAYAAPNSSLNVPVQGVGTARLTLNKQVRGPRGALTVTALDVGLPLPGGRFQHLAVSSVTCHEHAQGRPSEPNCPCADEPGSSTPPASAGRPPAVAPRPRPVPSNLPVTG